MNRPPVVSAPEWQTARDSLLVREKELTHAADAVAAARRRLPMVQLSTSYGFVAPSGETVGLLDLFDGKQQLVVYHFMLQPGSGHICDGCSSFTDNLASDQTHLNARDTRLILMSPAPQSEISPIRSRFGWPHAWYSAHGNDFYADLGLGEGFGLSVLLKDGSDVFRTYYTSARGVDRLRTDLNLLDLTPYGRKEEWEDSPDGWPQEPTWTRVKLRDEY